MNYMKLIIKDRLFLLLQKLDENTIENVSENTIISYIKREEEDYE